MPWKPRHATKDGQKKCTRCRRWKLEVDFHSRKLRGKPYVTAQCKRCVIRQISAYQNLHRDSISVKKKAYYRKEIERWRKFKRNDEIRHGPRRAFIWALKANPCSDCGVRFHPAAMDLDHVRGKKHADISRMTNGSFTDDQVMEELLKCELVCANCHRVRTHTRRTGA